MKAYKAYSKDGHVTAESPRAAAEKFFSTFPNKRECNIVEGEIEGPFFVLRLTLSKGARPYSAKDVLKSKIHLLPNANWVRAHEYLASMAALAAHFGGTIKDYNIDWGSGYLFSTMVFDMPDIEGEEIARRLELLGAYNPETLRGLGDCKLTGCYTDETAIDGFRIAFIRDGERELHFLMRAAFKTWMEAAKADYHHDFSDEGVSDMAAANNWEFTADGEL